MPAKKIDRSAPNLDRETPDVLDVKTIEDALRERYGAAVRVSGREGAEAVAICAVLGDDRHAHEVMVFARGEGAHDLAVDYLDGLIDEISTKGGPGDGRYLSLDWEGRPFDGEVVFVRGEVRDYVAEAEAAKLLGEAAPRRGLEIDRSERESRDAN
jgi:hypothetical protein